MKAKRKGLIVVIFKKMFLGFYTKLSHLRIFPSRKLRAPTLEETRLLELQSYSTNDFCSC